MKLTMKNDYSFQKVIGHPDDPEMMSVDEVKDELARWSEVVGSWMEGDEPSVDQIAGLDGFLSALATETVVYEEPYEEYKFFAGFEYYKCFTVMACSVEDARQKAKLKYAEYKERLPKLHNGLKLGICYLEDDVHGERLIEEG